MTSLIGLRPDAIAIVRLVPLLLKCSSNSNVDQPNDIAKDQPEDVQVGHISLFQVSLLRRNAMQAAMLCTVCLASLIFMLGQECKAFKSAVQHTCVPSWG